MKEKNAKNVSLGAGLAPPRRGRALQSLPGRAAAGHWRARAEISVRSPEEPESGREIDGFLPSPPPQRVLCILWSSVFCHAHDVARRCSIHRQQSGVKWRLCMGKASLPQHVAKERSRVAAPCTLMCGGTLISMFSPPI